MLVTRTSKLTGIIHILDLPITEDQLIDYRRGALIQDALWNLTASQREFFMTGITEEEWQQFVDVSEEGDYDATDEPDHGNSLTKHEGNYYDEN